MTNQQDQALTHLQNLADYTTALILGDTAYLKENPLYVNAINLLLADELKWELTYDPTVMHILIKNAVNLEHHVNLSHSSEVQTLSEDEVDMLAEYYVGYFGNDHRTLSLTSHLSNLITEAITEATGFGLPLGLDGVFQTYKLLVDGASGMDMSIGYIQDTLAQELNQLDTIATETPDHFQWLKNTNYLCFNLSNLINQEVNPMLDSYIESYGLDHPTVDLFRLLYNEFAELTQELAQTPYLVDPRFRSTHAVTLLLNTVEGNQLLRGNHYG